jgi:uncharacterized SAM-binding protein YcdF (DUF218 family)
MSISRIQRLLALTLVVLAASAMLGAGHMVAREDPLQKADAIYVLGGSWIQRWLEAADLYREGYAPRVVISRGTVSEGERELARRGVRLPGEGDMGRTAMITYLKVPAGDVEVLRTDVDNTAQEATAIAPIVAERHWRRIIVITDRASTRRAGFAMRRVLGPDVDIIMRAPRIDSFPPSGWWKQRANFRTVFYEAPKLLAYWLGLKG